MTYQSFVTPAHEYWGKKVLTKTKTDDVLGLEFENETLESFMLPSITGWTHHEEGSLRNFGFEYVLRTPKSKDKLELYIDRYFQALTTSLGSLSKLTNGRRTSTHVHFDVGHWNFVEILTASCLYWLMEPLLMEFCGEHRKGNHFCLGSKDSLSNIASLRTNIKEAQPWHATSFSNEFRYASLNLASVPKFGSLEFRLMRGLSDKETLWTWIEILDKIRLFSLNFSSPKNLHDKFLNDFSAYTFPVDVLGMDLYKKLVKTFPIGFNHAEEIRDVFVYLTPLMLSHKTWEFSKEIEEEKKRSEKEKADSLAWYAAQGINLNTLSPGTIVFNDASTTVSSAGWGIMPEAAPQESLPEDEDYNLDYLDDDFEPYIPPELEEGDF